MEECIKCGKPIPDGELFCKACDMNPGTAEPRPRVAAQSGRMQAPVKQVERRPEPPKRPETAAQSRPRRESRALLAVAWGLAVLGIGLSVWQYAGRARQQRSIRLREEAVAEQESEMQALREQTKNLQAELETAEQKQEEQARQIEALQKTVNSAESSANQSQYDLTEQQKQLQEALEENEALTAQAKELEEKNGKLETEKAELQAKYDAQNGQIRFVDSYVVFIEDDGTGQYHKYGCSRFLKKNFWAYSRKLAEKQGYTPCEQCFGG